LETVDYIFPIGVLIPLDPLHFLLLLHDVAAIATTKSKSKAIVVIFFEVFMVDNLKHL
jgi:hypothetical protein